MSTATDSAVLSPATQQLVQSTIHIAKQNGEQLLNILNNHDIEASIAQAVKLLEPLARDGVTVNDSYTVGGSLQNQLPSKGYYQLWLSVTAELDKFEQYSLLGKHIVKFCLPLFLTLFNPMNNSIIFISE